MARVTDFGTLHGELLVFGGPYSNLQATQALFEACADIPKSNRICTGDLVAYCADPAPTAQLVLDQCAIVVAGNCERQLADGADECGCGFEEGSACDLASKGWYPFAVQRMGAFQKTFAALPDIAIFAHEGRRCAVIHGGVSDIARFIWPVSADEVFHHEINLLQAEVGAVDVVIAGHCGIAFERTLGTHHWINAGVIGMPPHDGAPATRYATWGASGLRFHNLAYDHRAAAQALRDVGLRQGYETALESGFWPSEDILPAALRR